MGKNRVKESDIERIENMRRSALESGNVDLATLPQPLRIDDGKRLVRVYVEGY